jgi:hypothetical protein
VSAAAPPPGLEALEARYGILDVLPRRLLGATITNLHGELRDRAPALVALREALLEGRLPARDALPWPAPSLRDTLLTSLDATGVVPFCRDNPDVADAVLASVLEVAEDTTLLEQRMVLAFVQLAMLERAQRPEPPPGGT